MDFSLLAQPLNSSHGPCGEDLVFSPEFDAIQEARRFDDPSLAQGEWVTEIKEADWIKVVRICEGVLTKQSKDLRVASWLAEARCKLDGLDGLADGYQLLGQLSENYWNDIHPRPEEDDFEARAGVLDWLVNQTPRLIRETPLTQSAKGSFSLIDHDSARATAKNIERNPDMAEELSQAASVTLDSFEAALKATPRQHFIAGARAAERLKEALQATQTALDARMGEYSPAFSASFDALDDVSRFFLRHAGIQDSQPNSAPDCAATASTGDAPGRIEPTFGGETTLVAGGPIRSRDQAIRQLLEIATFFRQTEPHSPVAYLAEKAAKWGSMSLHQWLRTVVKDGGALLHMEELLGVENQSGESN